MTKLTGIIALLLLLAGFLNDAHGALDQTSTFFLENNTGSTTTVSLSPTAGCAVFVTWVGWNTSNYDASAVGDNQGGSYTVITDTISQGSAPMIAYLQAASSGVTAITITHSNSSGNYVAGRAFSWCGQAATMADQSGEGFTNSGTSSSASTTGATTTANQLVIAVIMVQVSSSDVHLSDPATSSYTSTFRNQDYASSVAGGGDYKVVSSTGTQTANWTHDDTTGGGATSSIIRTFKLSTTVARRRAVIIQ